MNGLDVLRERLAQYLRDSGLDAVCAYPGQNRVRAGKPLAAVSLRGCEGGQAGFRDYLGERYDEGSREWREVYGKKLRLTFGADVYAVSAEEAQNGLDTLAGAFQAGGPEGMKCVECSFGETVYKPEARRFFCPAQLCFEAWLYAVADESGSFTDFQVKGDCQA